jgi:isoaspartyl peptidase/L-asparaginase-like protein (Ntn-hydrolase superfamily)
MSWALAVHGGAGAIAERLYAQEEAHMADLLAQGAAMLERGESALDVVTQMAEALEAPRPTATAWWNSTRRSWTVRHAKPAPSRRL